jgi:hypothetical protein
MHRRHRDPNVRIVRRLMAALLTAGVVSVVCLLLAVGMHEPKKGAADVSAPGAAAPPQDHAHPSTSK